MNPGSSAALGCLCDTYENNFGVGREPISSFGRRFVVVEACPIHGGLSWTTHYRRYKDFCGGEQNSTFTVHSYTNPITPTKKD